MTSYTITRLGQQGDGIAEGPVYAPRTLPGDIVTGALDGNRLTEIKIQTPSPDRVTPPCRHFRACGGCQLQHGSDAFVANWKSEIVAASLAAYGLTAEFLPPHSSPARSRRRAGFAARRTKKGALAGFHARGSDVIVEIPDCLLLDPDLKAAIPAAEALAITGASRKAAITVAATVTMNGLDLAVSGGKPLDGPLRIELAALAERFGLARLAWDDEIIVTRQRPEQIFGATRVQPPPGSFLQATAEGQEALLSDVRRIVAGARQVADLFAGCGTFSLPLAETAELHAVEGDGEMLDALDAAWRQAAGLKRLSHEARDLFRRPLMADELARFEAVVLDPPRAGAQAQVAELCQARVPRIAYVSCNPTSFARDAQMLIANGYDLGPVRVVDQFRWSTHIELVAGFSVKTG